jgi:glycosyltransferase involved in cell wall biosynthesis
VASTSSMAYLGRGPGRAEVPDIASCARVVADGKFLLAGGDVFRVRGVTYGSFRARADGERYPTSDVVARDFRTMVDAGLNTVRTYSLPPLDVLDLAAENGLHLLVGLHYDDWRAEARPGRAARRRILEAGRRALAEALDRCAGRPEVLALAVGNEVPGDLVRLHGIRSVEETLSELISELRSASGDLLATYVNYPTTEYLCVDGQDVVCFNVFLEDPNSFRRYLQHLQVVAGDRPLLITELGLAGDVHGSRAQERCLAWQLRLVDETGCAGAAVFSWTDDWVVGGAVVEGWGFGLTDTQRRPKPALDVVRSWTSATVGDLRASWPRISAVVCAHNEEELIGQCLASLERCQYPSLEVIVCDDASTDRTAEIARRFPFRLLELERGGLSRARNAGIAAATGEIVAFLDADAACHPEWPFHLALSLEDDSVAATGGPNISLSSANFVERAVALAPGAPTEVLVADNRAEHVPGCNMAFRKEALEAIAGFDPIHTAAGDDVDVCWKLLDRGFEIAFAAAAQVHHHRPATIRDYLRQQRSYGRAERVLSGEYRSRFNRIGQARWTGFIYRSPRVLPRFLRPVVYHGPMGLAPFQPVTSRRSDTLAGRVGPLVPLAIPFALAGLLAFVSFWWLLAPIVALALLLAYALAIAHGVRPERSEPKPRALRLLVGGLHVLQPIARTWGRIGGRPVSSSPRPSPAWTGDRHAWLVDLVGDLERRRCHVRTGGPTRGWDISVSVGPLVNCRITTAVAWRWSPRRRIAYRPRPLLVSAVVAAPALAVFAPLWAVIGLSAVAVAAAVECAAVARLVQRSVANTTAGAES